MLVKFHVSSVNHSVSLVIILKLLADIDQTFSMTYNVNRYL